MKPTIYTSEGGKISIGEETISYDFYINADGEIVRRVQLSDEDFDTPKDVLSLAEAAYCYDPAVHQMLIGCNDQHKLIISSEAIDFFDEHQFKIKILPIEEAIKYWNRYEGPAVGLFHLQVQ